MKVLEGCASITDRSARFCLFRPQLEFYGQLPDKLAVEVRIAVLGELVEDEPITNLGLGQHVFQTLCDILIILVSHLNNRKIT